MGGDGGQLLIDRRKQGGDTLHGGVVMRLSSSGKAVTLPAWKRRLTPASPTHASSEFVKLSKR